MATRSTAAGDAARPAGAAQHRDAPGTSNGQSATADGPLRPCRRAARSCWKVCDWFEPSARSKRPTGCANALCPREDNIWPFPWVISAGGVLLQIFSDRTKFGTSHFRDFIFRTRGVRGLHDAASGAPELDDVGKLCLSSSEPSVKIGFFRTSFGAIRIPPATFKTARRRPMTMRVGA